MKETQGRQTRYFMIVSMTLLPVLSLVVITIFLFFHPIFMKMEFITDTIYEEIRPIRNLQHALIRALMPPNDFLVHGKIDEKKHWERSKDEVDNLFKIVSQVPADIEEKEKLISIRQQWSHCVLLGNQLFEKKVNEGASGELAELMEIFDERVVEAANALDNYVEFRESNVTQAYHSIHKLKTKTILATLGAIFLGMVSGIFGSIWLSKSRSKMLEFATKDALTGVYNRRTLDDALHRLNEDKIPFSILLMDLDNFKSINDTHGHDAGDSVLRFFAEETQKVLRRNDLFGRYGGEEFLILLYNTKLDHATILAERIRAAIESSTVLIPSAGTHFKVTVSIGCAEGDGSKLSEDVLKMADKAMYKAKQSGRNLVKIAKF